MTLDEAETLIRNERIMTHNSQKWADLGCGNGLFTRALLNLLPDKSIVYAIDKKSFAFSNQNIHFSHLDFEKEFLSLPPLNGLMMANSLHFIKNKLPLLQKLKMYLKPGGAFLLIEYNTEKGNRWVPYPLSFSSAITLFKQAGFTFIEKINER